MTPIEREKAIAMLEELQAIIVEQKRLPEQRRGGIGYECGCRWDSPQTTAEEAARTIKPCALHSKWLELKLKELRAAESKHVATLCEQNNGFRHRNAELEGTFQKIRHIIEAVK
jgi:hypothetical protein